MMSAKAELERELIFCKARIESLEEQLKGARAEKEELFRQIDKLQEALISIQAPDAYRDQQIAKEPPRPPMSAEAQERNRITKEFMEKYMAGLEGPLFPTPDHLDDLIRTGIIRDKDPVPASLHGNDES